MIAPQKLQQDYGTEMTLIILCCRLYFQTASVKEVNFFIAQHDLNDELFLRLCRRHKIRPVALKMILQTDITPNLKDMVKHQLLTVLKEKSTKTNETERLINLLNKHNIAVSVYKGGAFAKQFYHDISLRESSDIDLIINKSDLDKIIDILEDDGYFADLNDVRKYLGDKYFQYYKDFSFSKFTGQKRIFLVEMHWSIAESHFSVPQSADRLLYDNPADVTLLKSTVPTVNKTSHFLSVFIHHTVKDTFRDLKALMDIAQCFISTSPEMQWDKVNETIDQLKLNNRFNLSLLLSQQLFGVEFSTHQNIYVNRKLSQHFLNQLCTDTLINTNGKIDRTHIYNQLVLRDNLGTMLYFSINYIKCLFLPMTSDFRFFHLPKKFFFMYPVLKPFRLLFKYNSSVHFM